MDINQLSALIYQLKLTGYLSNQRLLSVVRYCLKQEYCDYKGSELAVISGIETKNYLPFIQTFEQFTPVLQDISEKDSYITIVDEAYPDQLKEIYNPPAILFYLGNIQLLKKPLLSMIGARNCSHYGRKMVEKLVPPLVDANFSLVSGLAKGIDTYVHQQTIKNQGDTIAIIGCGLNQYYPKENKLLQDEIAKEYLILSEYLPNIQPKAYHFPERNRIIAGLSYGTCIIEAKVKSGTAITAQLALDAGREVFSVPGSCLTESSSGCHHLIQQGAKLVYDYRHIIEEIFRW